MVGQHKRRGYTLLEVLLVVAILIITAALAIPTMENMMAGDKLVAGGDIVKSRLNEMRTRAREQNCDYRLTFTEGSDAFKIEPVDQCNDGTVGVVIEDRLPRDIVFKGATGTDREPGADGERNTATTTEIMVLRSGKAAHDYAISLGVGNTSGGRPLVVKMVGMTGAVTSGMGEAGDQ